MNGQDPLTDLLSVGLVATIHLAGRTAPVHRYLTSIRGWRKDSYITLDLPIVSARYVPIKKDMECVVRFFADGRACGFDARVISVNASIENPYLQVAWPDACECITIRRFERIATHIPGTVMVDGNVARKCEVVDISAGGCRLLTDFAANPGSLLRLSFALPDATWLENVKTFVRSVKRMADRNSLGCEFAEDEKTAQTSSGFYVSSTLQRLRSSSDATNRRLLIIEKDDSVVEVIRAALEAKGYEVISARNVVDGFFRLRMLPPRALLLNYNLTDLRPLEIFRLLRQSTDFQRLPVFIYGGQDPELAKKAPAIGLTGYISSENMLQELAKALARTTDHSVEWTQ